MICQSRIPVVSAGRAADSFFFMTELKFLLGQQTGFKAGACIRSLVLSCLLEGVSCSVLGKDAGSN